MVGHVYVKHGGAWVEPTNLYVKRSGAWVEPLEAYVKTGGVWQQFYPQAPTGPTASLVVSYTAGGDRNDFDGEIGYVFRPNADKAFTWIGCRAATGNTGLHTVKLYRGGVGLLHTAQINMTGATVGTMVWAAMPSITLAGGVDHILQKVVTGGGPMWANVGPTTLQLVTNVAAVYALTPGAFTVYTANEQFVGLDLGW